MYLDYFGFDEPPFSITPDPKFVFLSQKHEESLAHLVYGISRGGGAGFVQLTGEVGTGKTTISRLLLDQIPEKTNIALILNPTVTPLELLQNICQELKISMRGIKSKLNTLIDKLNKYLLKSWSEGESTVVIIDEAQNLSRDTLEQLRLLTNLETNTHKLLQIILIGQPELRSTMRRNDLRQLAQRVTARYHLMPLSAAETFNYLQHRISVAGGNTAIVSKSLSKQVHKITNGVPRLINILMDRALLAAYSDDSEQINIKHIKTAAIEVMPENNQPKFQFNGKLFAVLAVVVFALTLLGVYVSFYASNQVTDDTNALYSLDKTKAVKQAAFQPSSTKNAWQKYYKLWDASSDKNWQKAQCPDNKDTGMACLRRQGNLGLLQKLNHPVLLQLENTKVALLNALGNETVELFNHENKFVPVQKQWLNNQWLGTYFIIWPMPAELLVEPDEQALQSWALEMANTLSTETINPSQLKEWVVDFQKSHGLLADGIIGKETQMTLSLMAYNGPTLN
ncbi:MAG: AAA family ATPase [Proteobacteria bacterium]|nr:AAA family ATPase [Pseudomonadota bacterium]